MPLGGGANLNPGFGEIVSIGTSMCPEKEAMLCEYHVATYHTKTFDAGSPQTSGLEIMVNTSKLALPEIAGLLPLFRTQIMDTMIAVTTRHTTTAITTNTMPIVTSLSLEVLSVVINVEVPSVVSDVEVLIEATG